MVKDRARYLLPPVFAPNNDPISAAIRYSASHSALSRISLAREAYAQAKNDLGQETETSADGLDRVETSDLHEARGGEPFTRTQVRRRPSDRKGALGSVKRR